MSQQFRRNWRLVVGDVDISAMDFSATVKKTLKPDPNIATFKVWGLSKDTRNKFEGQPGQGVSGKRHKGPKGEPKGISSKPTTVLLEGGYEDKKGQIYLGQVRSAQTVSNGPEQITQFSTGDSIKAIQEARISVPVGPGASVDTALNAIAQAFGVGVGNVSKAVQNLKARGVTSLHRAGGAMYGPTSEILDNICNSAGLEWSIQDGQLQLLDVGQPLQTTNAIELSSDTGLVGSPAIDSAGYVTCRALLNAELKPGVKVSIDSDHVRGGFRITAVEYSMESFGQNWYSNLTCKKY